MKAAIWTGDNTVAVEDIDPPQVPEGWVKIRVAANGICGTDLAIYHGKHPRARHGLVMGHEISGFIDDPSRDDNGQLVVVEPLIHCGSCSACRAGHTHVCANLGLYGIDQAGALAQWVAVPEEVVHPVAQSVDPHQAALVEPLAVAVHALEMSGMGKGASIIVFGAGPIGVLTALVARAYGAENIVITDPNEWRLRVAGEMGFDTAATAEDIAAAAAKANGGDGFDFVFDAAGHPAVTPQTTPIVKPRGRIIIVGVHKQPSEIDLRDICFKEIVTIGVRVYTTADFKKAVALVGDESLGLDKFPVKKFPLDRIADALESAQQGADNLKVLVIPPKEA